MPIASLDYFFIDGVTELRGPMQRNITNSRVLSASEEDVKRKIAISWNKACSYYDCNGVLRKEIASREEEAWRAFLLREIGNKRMRILDVGTGTGFLSLILASLGHEVVGIDMSDGMLSVCNRKAKDRGLKIDLKIGDAEYLTLEEDGFDVVVCRWVLWTLPHPERAISEWKRILKPGGRAYAFDTPYADQKTDRIARAIKDNLSKLIITAVERRNGWSSEYDRAINDSLPLHYDRPGSFKKEIDLFEACGFIQVETSIIEEVSAIWTEKWNCMPLRYRLGCRENRKWHFISGRKQS